MSILLLLPLIGEVPELARAKGFQNPSATHYVRDSSPKRGAK